MAAAGVAAVAASAAGAYWFYGAANAAKNRKTARSWMIRARADVLEAVEVAAAKMGQMDKESYLKLVDTVVKRYAAAKGATAAELAEVTRDMKGVWDHMQRVGKAHIAKSKPKAAPKKTASAKKKK